MRSLPPCRLCAVFAANAASVGGQRDGGGQAARHFKGETRPGQHAAAGVAHYCVDHLVRQQAAAGFEALAHPEEGHGRRRGLELFQHRPQARQRRGENRQIGAGQCGTEIGSDLQAGGKWATRQVASIFTAARHLGHLRGITGPQRHSMPRAEGNGQRRTPGAGAEHRYPHQAPRRAGWLMTKWPPTDPRLAAP
jgi:hypothetical protein